MKEENHLERNERMKNRKRDIMSFGESAISFSYFVLLALGAGNRKRNEALSLPMTLYPSLSHTHISIFSFTFFFYRCIFSFITHGAKKDSPGENKRKCSGNKRKVKGKRKYYVWDSPSWDYFFALFLYFLLFRFPSSACAGEKEERIKEKSANLMKGSFSFPFLCSLSSPTDLMLVPQVNGLAKTKCRKR